MQRPVASVFEAELVMLDRSTLRQEFEQFHQAWPWSGQARFGPTTPTRAGKSYALTPTAVVALVGSISNQRFVYHAAGAATSSQKFHSDGFLYFSGRPLEVDRRLREGFDDGAKSRLAA
jgi:hypothetical protein